MNKGMEVFNQEPKVQIAEARKVLEDRLDPRLIKKRKQGNTELSYIGGHTVIRLLNRAFGYQWSFEIVSDEIVESLPKPVWSGYGRNRRPVTNPDGSQKMEEQPPVVKVLGRLTVPGYGVKEQYGSKVIIGGATEQEASFKSASTDALKKCATLFGIGLELYEDEEDAIIDPPEQIQEQPREEPAPTQRPAQKPQEQARPAQQEAQTSQKEQRATSSTTWKQEDVTKLKELKTILGISDNAHLDPYVREFLDDGKATYKNISPANIAAFNVFLSKKIEVS